MKNNDLNKTLEQGLKNSTNHISALLLENAALLKSGKTPVEVFDWWCRRLLEGEVPGVTKDGVVTAKGADSETEVRLWHCIGLLAAMMAGMKVGVLDTESGEVTVPAPGAWQRVKPENN